MRQSGQGTRRVTETAQVRTKLASAVTATPSLTHVVGDMDPPHPRFNTCRISEFLETSKPPGESDVSPWGGCVGSSGCEVALREFVAQRTAE